MVAPTEVAYVDVLGALSNCPVILGVTAVVANVFASTKTTFKELPRLPGYFATNSPRPKPPAEYAPFKKSSSFLIKIAVAFAFAIAFFASPSLTTRTSCKLLPYDKKLAAV